MRKITDDRTQILTEIKERGEINISNFDERTIF